MKKRIMSSLLVICMLFVMMPSTAFAATTITKVVLTIDAPDLGKLPSSTAKLSSNAHSTVEKVEWSGTFDIDGTFMSRTTYKVTVTLGIKKGANYIFSDKSINATVNGKAADEVFWYAKDKVTVTYTFPQFGTGDTVNTAYILLEEPTVGAKPATTAHISSTSSTYIKDLKWTGELDSSGCFKAGVEYTAKITLDIKDGLNRKFTTNAKSFKATVNGVLIDAATLTRVSDKELIVPVEFNRLSGPASTSTKVLEEASMTITAPEAGKTPSTTVQLSSTDDYYVKNMVWSGALDNGKFKGGVEYTATITLGIKSGSNAKFSDTVFDATVNGVVIDASTLTRVSDKELIIPVEFERLMDTSKPSSVGGFSDVLDSDYFANPVLWAVDKKITTGTGAGKFSPNVNCSQAEILTFLWRAAGSPKPQGTVHTEGFTGKEYYYQALLWAVDRDMVSEGEFDPAAPCTRAIAVTYMWKHAGSPSAPTTNFSDISSGSSYAPAVAWAVNKGVTNGVGNNNFAPQTVCTRSQIVTFLYRGFAS